MSRAITVVYAGDPDRGSHLVDAIKDADVDVVIDAPPPDIVDRLDGIDCVITEHESDGVDGLALLEQVRDHDPDLPVILYPGDGSETVAGAAVTAGATDYLPRENPGEQAENLTERVRESVAEYRAAQRREEWLEQFVSLVSHDLRNPLNVAMGRLQLVAETTDSDQVEVLERSLDRMEALIDNVVDFARLGEPVGPGETRQIHLGQAVEGCWQIVDPADAALRVDVDSAIEAEERRLRRLLEEIIENSIIHAGPGVTVEVGEFESGFYLADDGPGIPESKRERALEAGRSTVDRAGFGLSIALQAAHAHRWNLRLRESEAGGLRVEVLTGNAR